MFKENTIDDLKDELKFRIMKHKFKTGSYKNDPKPGFKEGLNNGRILLNTLPRQERLKRDAKLFGTGAGIVGASVLALKVLKDRKRKKNWHRNGCDNIESKSERLLCNNYMDSLRLRRER